MDSGEEYRAKAREAEANARAAATQQERIDFLRAALAYADMADQADWLETNARKMKPPYQA